MAKIKVLAAGGLKVGRFPGLQTAGVLAVPTGYRQQALCSLLSH